MKPNYFLLIIALGLTALVGYSVYAYSVEARKVLSTIVFCTTFLVYLGMLFGFRIEYPKAQILKNTVSILFIIFSLLSNLYYLNIEYTIPLYLLINISPLLIYAVIINFFSKPKF